MKRKILLLVAGVLFANVALAQPAGVPPAKPSAPPADAGPHELPEGPGKTVIQTACAQCHGVDVATNQPRSREEWTDVVSRMVGNGAQLSDDDYNRVIDYLAKHYGPPGASAPANGN